ncbi:hypothetical protein SS50377_25172 [Spironucleus salmonicida]|uniref:Uncharacterized protein n=2 Tax=Spironucleus salmonicida TaxID=348837 RepID=A0A9P8LRU0_9EUKA|nr:hypothetical protein SS50377_25172 [Spironucleus salmonicida]
MQISLSFQGGGAFQYLLQTTVDGVLYKTPLRRESSQSSELLPHTPTFQLLCQAPGRPIQVHVLDSRSGQIQIQGVSLRYTVDSTQKLRYAAFEVSTLQRVFPERAVVHFSQYSADAGRHVVVPQGDFSVTWIMQTPVGQIETARLHVGGGPFSYFQIEHGVPELSASQQLFLILLQQKLSPKQTKLAAALLPLFRMDTLGTDKQFQKLAKISKGPPLSLSAVLLRVFCGSPGELRTPSTSLFLLSEERLTVDQLRPVKVNASSYRVSPQTFSLLGASYGATVPQTDFFVHAIDFSDEAPVDIQLFRDLLRLNDGKTSIGMGFQTLEVFVEGSYAAPAGSPCIYQQVVRKRITFQQQTQTHAEVLVCSQNRLVQAQADWTEGFSEDSSEIQTPMIEAPKAQKPEATPRHVHNSTPGKATALKSSFQDRTTATKLQTFPKRANSQMQVPQVLAMPGPDTAAAKIAKQINEAKRRVKALGFQRK